MAAVMSPTNTPMMAPPSNMNATGMAAIAVFGRWSGPIRQMVMLSMTMPAKAPTNGPAIAPARPPDSTPVSNLSAVFKMEPLVTGWGCPTASSQAARRTRARLTVALAGNQGQPHADSAG